MKIGDYVRTEDGIKKVLKYTYNEKYENGHCVWFDNKDYGTLFTDEEVNRMKPSPNIIDLIEEGDYVNGYPVEKIYIPTNEQLGKIIKFACENVTGYEYEAEELCEAFGDKIKTIVTKEQFESMEYKVGE